MGPLEPSSWQRLTVSIAAGRLVSRRGQLHSTSWLRRADETPVMAGRLGGDPKQVTGRHDRGERGLGPHTPLQQPLGEGRSLAQLGIATSRVPTLVSRSRYPLCPPPARLSPRVPPTTPCIVKSPQSTYNLVARRGSLRCRRSTTPATRMTS